MFLVYIYICCDFKLEFLMSTPAKKTVAAISFHNDKNLSIDIENVSGIYTSLPQQMNDDIWFVDLIIRSEAGNVSLQLTSDSLDKLIPTEREEIG